MVTSVFILSLKGRGVGEGVRKVSGRRYFNPDTSLRSHNG